MWRRESEATSEVGPHRRFSLGFLVRSVTVVMLAVNLFAQIIPSLSTVSELDNISLKSMF